MAYWKTPKFVIRYLKGFIWHGHRTKKVVYLTFDDGPTPVVTERVLEILDEYQAKATFFCLGRNVDRHRDLYCKILESGHATGNHTYSHLQGWATSLKTYIQDTILAQKYIDSPLFRPPYGRISIQQAKYLRKSYKLIMWDVMTHDYNKRLPHKMILRNVIKNTKNGSIIVFHDSVKASQNLFLVLPAVLKYYKEKGYSFEKIS